MFQKYKKIEKSDKALVPTTQLKKQKLPDASQLLPLPLPSNQRESL